jgi:hypothetical protein
MTKAIEVFGKNPSLVIQTAIVIDSELVKAEDINKLTRLTICRDVITNQKTAVLFSDDGKGNGFPILYFDID